jgi:hypothetical protein
MYASDQPIQKPTSSWTFNSLFKAATTYKPTQKEVLCIGGGITAAAILGLFGLRYYKKALPMTMDQWLKLSIEEKAKLSASDFSTMFELEMAMLRQKDVTTFKSLNDEMQEKIQNKTFEHDDCKPKEIKKEHNIPQIDKETLEKCKAEYINYCKIKENMFDIENHLKDCGMYRSTITNANLGLQFSVNIKDDPFHITLIEIHKLDNKNKSIDILDQELLKSLSQSWHKTWIYETKSAADKNAADKEERYLSDIKNSTINKIIRIVRPVLPRKLVGWYYEQYNKPFKTSYDRIRKEDEARFEGERMKKIIKPIELNDDLIKSVLDIQDDYIQKCKNQDTGQILLENLKESGGHMQLYAEPYIFNVTFDVSLRYLDTNLYDIKYIQIYNEKNKQWLNARDDQIRYFNQHFRRDELENKVSSKHTKINIPESYCIKKEQDDSMDINNIKNKYSAMLHDFPSLEGSGMLGRIPVKNGHFDCSYGPSPYDIKEMTFTCTKTRKTQKLTKEQCLEISKNLQENKDLRGKEEF